MKKVFLFDFFGTDILVDNFNTSSNSYAITDIELDETLFSNIEDRLTDQEKAELNDVSLSTKEFLALFKEQKIKPRFKNTPDPIPNLEANEVFVFGANSEGTHAGGAAKVASLHYGAVMGEIHRTGRCYGLVTLDWSFEGVRRLSSNELQEEFELFLKQVDLESEKTFYLTKVGIGIAGFELDEIVSPLKAAMLNNNKRRANLVLPIEFEERILELQPKITTFVAAEGTKIETTPFTTAC